MTTECPVCGADVKPDAVARHLTWHEQTRTLNRWTFDAAMERAAVRSSVPIPDPDYDDAPTQKFPPIGETLRRRPPVPPPAEVRELRGAELLRALAGALEREDLAELDREDQGDDDGAHS